MKKAFFIHYSFTFRLVSGQYAAFLYRYLKEWRKNPRWSFSCCLSLLLPLSDSHGEIPDLIETNQLQTGQIDMPTILTAVDEEAEDGNSQRAKYYNSKCHQGTQTELFAPLSNDFVVNKSIEKKLK